MRSLIAGILALILPLTDCAGTEDGEGTSTGTTTTSTSAASPAGDVEFASTLQNFDDCDALLAHIRAEAMSRVGPYGLDGDRFGPFFGAQAAAEEAEAAIATADRAAAPAPAVAGNDGGAGGPDFSGTNVQVIGVDEPDIVKTDGRRIITVRNGTLTVVDITGAEPTITGRVLLGERWGGELLLHGDRALVINNHYGTIQPLSADDRIGGYSRDIVIIDEILLDGTPRRGRSLHTEGRYVSSRSIDGTARVVIVSYPSELGFVYPRNRAGEPIATHANRKVVAESTLEDWLPDYRVVSSEGTVTEEGQILACDRVYVPSQFSGFGSLAVLTFDLDEPLSLGDGAATFAAGETIYASHENLYVATNTWLPQPFFDDDSWLRDIDNRYRTSIHKFSLTRGGPAVYEASGSVKGHLLNQFSLHEHDGHLFVAVTNGSPWGANRQSESLIFALTQKDDILAVVGSVGDMGRGERIYSVRYIGDRAYVVTFRQVDPLYVVDLADPTSPAVLGELKIPGYSAYLHPVGDGLLVGIGRDADDDGRIRGFKASLFDVSDPAKPAEIDTWTLADAESSVEWDHRAFLWWAPEQLMIVPVWSWRNEVPSGAAVFKVTAEAGLDYQGLIAHSTEDFTFSTDCYHEFDSEAVEEGWEIPLLLVCTPGQVGNPVGYGCETVPAAAARNWDIDVEALGIEVGSNDRIQLCWPQERGDAERIDRSLIIGEDVWTLSRSLLQSNDLDTLDRRARLTLPG
ncbi:MAG: benzoate transporter [Acidimicrobiia bacterium]|nr:benzoate transporter [Acidimicrobiia bacterium]MYC45906.1 benzoate transporter [Acidimicrobiia bacterium]MYI20017.1 benzoate transporter [Acidimicrobiia bacterium]